MTANTNLEQESALFDSAVAAIKFALNYSGQNYQRAGINQLSGGPAPKGRGLGGLDGAAQAGMIRAELATIGLVGEAFIVAEMAVKTKPCFCKAACCSGEVTNPEWAAAIGVLSNVAKDLKLCPAHVNVRTNIIRRFFGVPLDITDIAKRCGVCRETVSSHNSRLVSTFALLRKKAWADFDTRLLDIGMIRK